MAPAKVRVLVTECDEADKQGLSLTITHDPQIEQLLRQWEAESKTTETPRPAPRPAPRREPFAYD